jgi:MerR family copper efflux transcriptional regulator
MGELTIGQVAQKAGVGIETIRFYERKGLIADPPRKESGYRQYGPDVLDRLVFIQQAKALGFSLGEIHELMSLRHRPDTSSRDIKKIATARLIDIEQKVKALKRMQRALKKLVDQCPGQGSLNECPILEALDTTQRHCHGK